MEEYLHSAPCIYFAVDDTGIIQQINNTACAELQYSREELIGAKADVIFPISTKIFYQTHLFPLLKMQPVAGEIYITLNTKKGDHIPVLINAKRTAETAVTEFAGILVHNRKKFEDELMAAKKAAEKAVSENSALIEAKEDLRRHSEELDTQMFVISKQNAELKQFNHVVTHDLQEPLRKLFVFTNMLEQENDTDATGKIIGKIRSSLNQMRSTLSGLQQYIWLTDAKISPVAVDMQGMIKLIKTELEQKNPDVTINISFPLGILPAIEGDRDQIKFLLEEVLANAIRFRKEGSTVDITISTSELTLNKYRRMSGKYKYTNFNRIEITDNGVGFDAEYKDQTFDLFKKLHNNSGRGIGLSLCKKIVEMHDGFIHINSKVGEGTSVRILLPSKQELHLPGRSSLTEESR